MSSYICKLLTDGNHLCVGYNSTGDCFFTKAVASADDLGAEFHEDDIESFKKGTDERIPIFDMRSGAIEKAKRLVSKLQTGENLEYMEMCALSNFIGFLDAAIATAQIDHPELSDAVFKGWIDDVGLRSQFPDYENSDIIFDFSLFPAVLERPIMKNRDPADVGRNAWAASENKLAGRYVLELMKIAGLIDTPAPSPEQIIERFLELAKNAPAHIDKNDTN